MKPYGRLLLIGSALTAVLVTASMAQKSSGSCDCPKDDPATHGRYETLIDKEMSSAQPPATSRDLGYAKSLTVCIFFDPTDKGYPTDLRLQVEGSIDGRMWFPTMLAGTRTRAEGTNGCLQVTPTRYVRVGWPQGSQIQSPGPRVTVQVQAGY